MIVKMGFVADGVVRAAVPLRHKVRVGLRIADDVLEYPPCEACYWDEAEFDQVYGAGSFEETLKFYEEVFAGEK